jgi:rod shape-determining protein MreD
MTGSRLVLGLFLVVLALLHLLLQIGFGLATGAPDLLVVALLLGARRMAAPAAAALGLVLGVVYDAVALLAFGSGAVVLTILGYLGARTRELFVGESLAFSAVYLFLGKWLHVLLLALMLRYGRGAAVEWTPLLLVEAPLAALYTAVAGVVALAVYRGGTGQK